jgi:hypothetical protein
MHKHHNYGELSLSESLFPLPPIMEVTTSTRRGRMNWNTKDEIVKNKVWTERCRKHLKWSRIGERWSMTRPMLERSLLTQEVSRRDARFLDPSPFLLASMSRYVSYENQTKSAQFVRSFAPLLEEKSVRPSEWARRPASGMSQYESRHPIAQLKQSEALSDHVDRQAQPVADCSTLRVRPQSAVPQCAKPTVDIVGSGVERRPQSATAVRHPSTQSLAAASAEVDSLTHSGPRRFPKWRFPVASSDAYGWMPSTVEVQWQDPRFSHRHRKTDVTSQ